MSYQGVVTVGGPPDVRELAHLIITKVAVGLLDNNAYFLRCRDTGDELLIDAADDPDVLIGTVGDGPLRMVVTTHQHADHWSALAEVVAATGAATVAHPDDAGAIAVPTTRLVTDGDIIEVGSVRLSVIHLPGHTPGSIGLLYDDPQGLPHLWTGDALFPGGIGKTTPDLFPQALQTVIDRVFNRLPDETWVYPGHGPDTVLGNERPFLEGWADRGW